MHGGMWLSQEDFDRLMHLVGDAPHKVAVPILQHLHAVQQRGPGRRVPPSVNGDAVERHVTPNGNAT